MAELAQRRDLLLLCYGSLAGGFLAERYRGRPEPREPLANRSLVKYRLIVDEFGGWDAYQELLAGLGEIAGKHGVCVSNVAARWTLERPRVGAVLVGIGRGDYLADALRMFDFRLDDEDLQRIAAILARHPGPAGDVYSVERVPGGRHVAIMKTNLNREVEA